MNRFLAMAGVGSRRKMDEIIAQGRVTVNGEVVREMGVQVRPGRDSVTVDGRSIEIYDREVTVLLNKPKDCITTLSDERGRTTVMHYVRVKQRVFPVGRLDRNTTGVLLLTNDGELANALLHPRREIERIYKVTTSDTVRAADLKALRKGVRLEDGLARAREVIQTEPKKVVLTLTEGRNREVRRMFETIGHTVKQLDRVAYAGITSAGLQRGTWRFLQKEEVRHLRLLAGLSERIPTRSKPSARKR